MNQRDFNPGKNRLGVGEEGRREMGSSEAGDRIKEFVEDVSNKATPYMKTAVHTVREAATPALQAAKEAAAPALQAAKDAATPAFQAAKDTATPALQAAKDKALHVASPYLEGVKKAAAPAAKAVRKQSRIAAKTAQNVGRNLAGQAMRAAAKKEFFLQYGDCEVRMSDIETRVYEDLQKKGYAQTEIRSLQVYLKPEEKVAYYVVNQKETGKVGF
ncbi:MAG: hypothetical protein HXK91_08950 [Lachnospiraceae bacterium]|nr:hypothetical protein [Lachnospiraceae bacterium]MBF1030300.1 hypothetical protein [Lachnospiraceae bacterium]